MNRRCLNILRTYDQATADEIRQGLEWYASAHDEAKRIHQDVRIGAAVIAVLSPGLRWERNIEAAERVINGESLDGLGVRWYAGVKKADLILRGADPRNIVSGNKVRSFWACIYAPDTTQAVCVDGHAYAIWCNRRITLDEVPEMTDRLYFRITADYAIVAKHLGIKPHQLQAVTWVAWRRIHGVSK